MTLLPCLYENGLVGLLIVDVGAVAAFTIANSPTAVGVIDRRVDTRAEGIAQDDRAIECPTETVLLVRIEQEMGSCPAANRHRQIGKHSVRPV